MIKTASIVQNMADLPPVGATILQIDWDSETGIVKFVFDTGHILSTFMKPQQKAEADPAKSLVARYMSRKATGEISPASLPTMGAKVLKIESSNIGDSGIEYATVYFDDGSYLTQTVRKADAGSTWAVYLFSNTGKTLWQQTFEAKDKAEAEKKGQALVKPVLQKFEDAEDWVVEKAKGKLAGVDSAASLRNLLAHPEKFFTKPVEVAHNFVRVPGKKPVYLTVGTDPKYGAVLVVRGKKEIKFRIPDKLLRFPSVEHYMAEIAYTQASRMPDDPRAQSEPALSVPVVTQFLKGLDYGPGGRAHKVNFQSGTYPLWDVEPTRRQRLDHYGNDGEGWDEEAWDQDYSWPIERKVREALDDKFGQGKFSVSVDEKGFVVVEPDQSIRGKLASAGPSAAQVQYAKHLLAQAVKMGLMSQADVPDEAALQALSPVEMSNLIGSLKKKRGKPQWYSNGQFGGFKTAYTITEKLQRLRERRGEDENGVLNRLDGGKTAVSPSKLNPFIVKGSNGWYIQFNNNRGEFIWTQNKSFTHSFKLDRGDDRDRSPLYFNSQAQAEQGMKEALYEIYRYRPGDEDYVRGHEPVKVASKTAAVVEVPHRFHPVKVEEPKAKRKEFPFEGYIDFQGLEIDVENVAGSTRRGTSPDGTEWASYMHYHYGEIRGTEGADGDKLDVYVGPNHDSSLVIVIHQVDPDTGNFDEDKVMIGFDSEEEAIGAYKKQYDRPGFYRPGQHTSMPIGSFWRWVHDEKNKGKKVTASIRRVASRYLTRNAGGWQ